MGYSEYLATLIASVLISGLLAVFFWRRCPAPGALTLAVLAGSVLIWSLGYIIELTVTSLPGFQLANSIEYVGIVSVPALWFIFATQYTRYDNWLTRRSFLFFIIPLITLVLVWTNDFHGWMWYGDSTQIFGEFLVQIKTYGPWFWVHSLYSYALIFAGIAVIGISLLHPRKLYRNQIMVILVCIVLPLVWNIIFVFRAAPTYHVDMTPPAFVVSGIVIALGLFRFNILKIVPIARNIVVENMNDGVIVLDRQDRVVDYNRAAGQITGFSASELVGEPVGRALAGLPELLKHIHDSGRPQAEMVINQGNSRRYYEIYLASLCDRRLNIIGRVVTLHEISDRKEMEQNLREYARRITQVQEDERKRIAYELHDDTAQYLSILKLQIDSLIRSEKIQSPEVIEKLNYLKTDADRAIQDVRRFSHELRPGVLEHLGLEAALKQIADDTNRLQQLVVEVNVEGEDPGLSEDVKLGFFRIAQEALNNARKHARAVSVNISLRFAGDRMKITIIDDGSGFNVEEAAVRAGKKGSLGLMSMRERARLIGADLKIESAPGKGTVVAAEMPFAESP